MSAYLYLYGFVPAGAPLPERGLAGIGDSVVELVPFQDFAAAVSRVDSADFGPDALEEHTRDLQWVGAHGVSHERVVAWFVDHAAILPVPLFTLYSGDAALAADAAARRDTILAAFERFRGLREWDLKVSYTDAELAAHAAELSPELAELDRRIAQAAPGTRFLLERKRQDSLRAEVSRAARREAAAVLELARARAARVRSLPLGQKAEELPVVLNAALLVASAEEAGLRHVLAEQAARLAPLGISILFSGPWAPYRFLALEEPVA